MNKVLIVVVIAVLLGVTTIMLSRYDIDSNLHINTYKETVSNEEYVVHALGGVGDEMYLNSIDVMKPKYDKGFRLYETDVVFASNGKLILFHGEAGSEKNFKKRSQGIVFDGHERIEYESFVNDVGPDAHARSTFVDLVNFMRVHKDAYVMIDTGRQGYDKTKELYTAIVDETDHDSGVLSRLIVGGHTTAAMKAVADVYNFPLKNLYFAADSLREGVIKTPEDFIRYCENNDINSLSISASRYTPALAERLNESSLITYVFTTDSRTEASKLIGRGASAVGTNFLE